MQRYIFLLISLLLLSLSGFKSHAQRSKLINLPTYDRVPPYHFGFILAANQMNFTVKPKENLSTIKWQNTQLPDISADSAFLYDITSLPTPGFTIGIVGDLSLNDHTNLRFIPSLAFGERILNYNILVYRAGEASFIETQKSVTSTMIDFPLQFKYRSKRLNNFRAYVLLGAKYSLDLSSQKRNQESNNNVNVFIERHDISAEIGTGVEFFTEYFKFGVEIKMDYGINNLLISSENIYTDGIEKLNSKIFQLSLTFE